MVKRMIFIFFLLIVGSQLQAQKTIRTLKNEAFKVGEKMKFLMHYGFIDAGIATLEVKSETEMVVGRKAYHILGTGESIGAFNFFFKVRDYFETFIDVDAIIPWSFSRKINEGGFKFNENLFFNHYKNTVTSNNGDNSGTYKVPDNVQDLISMYYYSRMTDVTNFKEGDIIPIETFIDNEVVTFNLKFVKREIINTKMGKYKALLFKPTLLSGRVFKEKEGMSIWISDDKNHIPLRLEAKLMVGSIKMDIKEYSGLANPPAIIE